MEEKINKLQEEICKSVKNLNFGGCCRFAYYFSEKLKKLNIPHSIYFVDNCIKLPSTLVKFKTPQHVYVYIKDIGFIDGYKTVKQNNYKNKTKINYKVEKALYKGVWNNTYNPNQDKELIYLINKIIK